MGYCPSTHSRSAPRIGPIVSNTKPDKVFLSPLGFLPVFPDAIPYPKDTTYMVDYQSGCIGWGREIGEYLVRDVLMIDDQIPPFPTKKREQFGLTELDKEKTLTEFKKRPKVL